MQASCSNYRANRDSWASKSIYNRLKVRKFSSKILANEIEIGTNNDTDVPKYINRNATHNHKSENKRKREEMKKPMANQS